MVTLPPSLIHLGAGREYHVHTKMKADPFVADQDDDSVIHMQKSKPWQQIGKPGYGLWSSDFHIFC